MLDDSDVHMFWASEIFARQLVREHKVSLIRRGNRTIALRAVAGACAEILELAGRGSALGGARYSDQREAPDNPQGVWRLRRLMRDPALYRGVLVSLCA